MNNINLALFLYVMIMFLATFIFTSSKETSSSFIVADRNLPENKCAFSIAATWIWVQLYLLQVRKHI